MARLIYVSNNVILPNGKQNPFFLQEKEWLLNRFGAFDVVCPKGLYCCKDARELYLCSAVSRWETICSLVTGAFDLEVYKELVHMLRDKSLTLRNALKLFRFSANAARMSKVIQKSFAQNGAQDILLYSYWLSYDAYAVAKAKKKHPELYALSRAHSYEVQLEKNNCNPYLMKNYICRYMDKIAFISKDSLASFQKYYSEEKTSICVQYLGSTQVDTGVIERSKKDILTVMSCSFIVPVKQIDWLIQALEDWDVCPIHWLHIGDGPAGDIIRTSAQEKLSKNPLVSYGFAGYMENREVREKMRQRAVDVFVNCSKVEGVPVSIMEAMSVGLPAIAPNICGIPELVDMQSGLLFELHDGVSGLAGALKAFAKMSAEERNAMGKCGFSRWEHDFCLQTNLEKLFSSAVKAE